MAERQHLRSRNMVLFIVSVICFLSTLSCMIAVLSYKPESDGVSSKQKVDLQICVSCDELTQNGTVADSEQLVINLRTPQTSQCCFENFGQLSSLLELLMKEPETVEAPLPAFDPENFTLSKASAHRQLVPGDWYQYTEVPIFDDDDLGLVIREMKKDGSSREHERNVTTGPNGQNISIIIPGQYFVYCSIHFKPTTSLKCKEFKKQTWNVHVVRTNPNKLYTSDILLSSAYTCTDDAVNVHETIYTAGIFDLQSNDQISVKISGIGLVSYQIVSSFMGVVMLSE